LNVENSVESVERFAILPQDMGLFSPFCPGFSHQHLRETVSDIIKNVKA